MLGAELQRDFFTFRTRGWHLQRFQKTWVVSTEFDLELNFLLLPYRQNCFSKSMKMLFIVKNTKQTFQFAFYCRLIGYRCGQHADPPSSIPKSKTIVFVLTRVTNNVFCQRSMFVFQQWHRIFLVPRSPPFVMFYYCSYLIGWWHIRKYFLSRIVE